MIAFFLDTCKTARDRDLLFEHMFLIDEREVFTYTLNIANIKYFASDRKRKASYCLRVLCRREFELPWLELKFLADNLNLKGTKSLTYDPNYIPSQSQFFAIFYCIEHYSAISRYKQTIFQWNQYDEYFAKVQKSENFIMTS